MKVASWNINSIRKRVDLLASFLERESPDVLCLQEIKCLDEQFPYPLCENLGYQALVHGQKAYHGVATLFKKDITVKLIQRGIGQPSLDSHSRLLGVRVYRGELLWGEIWNAYAPNGQLVGSEQYSYKLEWFDSLTKMLQKRLPDNPWMLLVGDLNVAPEDRDVYDPKSWAGKILFSEKEKDAFYSLCRIGLTDLFRQFHPDSGLYSWWDYRHFSFQKNHGARIDFMLATKPLSDSLLSMTMLKDERAKETPSDHVPLVACFKHNPLSRSDT